jgi:hypothetical protein
MPQSTVSFEIQFFIGIRNAVSMYVCVLVLSPVRPAVTIQPAVLLSHTRPLPVVPGQCPPTCARLPAALL